MFLVIAILSLSTISDLPPSAPGAYRQHYEAGIKACRAGQRADFLKHTLKAHLLNPNHFGSRYNLAVAYAVNDLPAKAVSILRSIAATGFHMDPTKEPSFASLIDREDFIAVRAAFERNGHPIHHATTAITLPQKDLYPEGIAYDDRDGHFYISSVFHRKVVKCRPDGSATDWITPGRDGLWSAMGLAIDRSRDLLWVASSAVDQTANLAKRDKGKSGLFAFSLKDATLERKAILSRRGRSYNLGDLTLAEDGTVYCGDGAGNTLYVLKPGASKLESLVRSAHFRSIQGLALSADGTRLYVADYSHGLFAVDLARRSVQPLAHPQSYLSVGCDGLVRHGNRLIGIQNGIRPHRVVAWTLGTDGTSLARQTVLEANNPEFDEPTLGTMVGTDYYFVATSQWGKYGKDHKPLPLEDLAEIQIMRIPLKDP